MAQWIGEFHFWEWLLRWSDTLGIVASAVLSLLLIRLYQQQKDLKQSEINREIQAQHTEEIRKRVQYWLGMEHPDDNYLVQFSGDPNLPSVVDGKLVVDDDNHYKTNSEFRVYPEDLENDRYFQDFLENHAPEVNERCERLRDIHSELRDLEDEFSSELGSLEISLDDFDHLDSLTATNWFKHLIFTGLIRIQNSEDCSEERIIKEITGPVNGLRISGDTVGAVAPGRIMHSFSTQASNLQGVAESDSAPNPPDLEDKIEEIIRKLILGYEWEGARRLALDASIHLTKAENLIDELENELIRYEGKPLYREDCQFVSDAKLDVGSGWF